MSTTFIDKITRTERMPSSRYGNPRWRVYFEDHDSAATEVDGSVGYGINNPEYRNGPVEVTLNGRGQVTYLKPRRAAQITTRYHSDPNTGAGKITARVSSGPERGRRVTVSYDHGAKDPHEVAAVALALKLGFGSVEYAGTVTLGNVYNTFA